MRIIDIKKMERAYTHVECAVIQLEKALDYLYKHPEHNLRTLSGETQKDCIAQVHKSLINELVYLDGKIRYFKETATK